jgi:hypothetical protein
MTIQEHYNEIRNLLTKAGFTVLSVSHSVNDHTEPNVGFHVTLNGKQKKGDTDRFYSILWNYAFSVKFKKIKWKARKGKKK